MSKKNDYVGMVFNKLTVVSEGGRTKTGGVLWLCQCICGGNAMSSATDLRKNKITSCGCYTNSGDAQRKHGFASKGRKRSKVYSLWAAMVQRCTNTNDKNWKNYGGRGITVCERWLIFENFFYDMGDKPEKLSLDRKDNNIGYFKENCRWASKKVQSRNTRSNVWITIGNKTQILADWIKEVNTSASAVRYIMKKGLTHEDALKRIMGKRSNKEDT